MKQSAQTLLVVLFLHPTGITPKDLKTATQLNTKEYGESLAELKDYIADSGLVLVESPNQLQLAAKSKLLPSTDILQASPENLSSAALEVLAIVAYRQPITRGEIEEIRGIGSEQSLRGLLEKDLIAQQKTTKSGITHIHYVTTTQFLRHSGLASLTDLPKIEE